MTTALRFVTAPMAPDLGMPMAYYASGASAPADLRGLARSGHPLGISITELSIPALLQLIAFATERPHLRVLADTGAFAEVEIDASGIHVVAPITEAGWRRRLAVQKWIARRYGSRALVVAPDRVGCQRTTLARLRRWAPRVREIRSLGARIVVAIQRGKLRQATFDRACCEALGFDDFARGIPSNKDAMPQHELEAFVREVRPAAAHLLGVGPRSAGVQTMVDVFRRLVPAAELSCDSNLIAAHVGRTNGPGGGPRLLTDLQDQIEAGVLGDFDESSRERAIVMAFKGPYLVSEALAMGKREGFFGRPPVKLQRGLFDEANAPAASTTANRRTVIA